MQFLKLMVGTPSWDELWTQKTPEMNVLGAYTNLSKSERITLKNKKVRALSVSVFLGYQTLWNWTEPIPLKGLSIAIPLRNFSKPNKRGKLIVVTGITPTLSYENLADVDLVVEAVVEKESVKKIVLAETEKN